MTIAASWERDEMGFIIFGKKIFQCFACITVISWIGEVNWVDIGARSIKFRLPTLMNLQTE